MELIEGPTLEQLARDNAELRRRLDDLQTAALRRLRVEMELRADVERKATAALGQSERKFKDLVQSINAIVWEADARTFEFSFVSEQAEPILGYPVEQWLREPQFWRNHLHPD